jgi:hypothetical protein
MPTIATVRRPRLATIAAGAAILAAGTAACGSSGHHTAAPTGSAAATTSTTAAPPTSTAAPAPLGVAPLTGLPQPAAAQLQAPAVVVKVDNVLGALPQTGINQADVVYEEMVEGGLTRLAAVFQSQYPLSVGPVRSGRLTDIAIVDDLNHPVLAFAGANSLFLPKLRAQPIQDVDINNHGDQFTRQGPNAAPHDLYTRPAAVAALDRPSAPPPALFGYVPAGGAFSGAGVAPATQVSVRWPAASAQWTFDAASHVWSRVQNGAPDLDRAGAQLTATNIVVQAVPYITSAEANESGVRTPIPEGELVGSGQVWIASGGQYVHGTWKRSSLSSVTTYTDGAGQPIALAPGTTWVELIASGTSPVVR